VLKTLGSHRRWGTENRGRVTEAPTDPAPQDLSSSMRPRFVLNSVAWNVHDLESSLAFYQRLGFNTQKQGTATAILSTGGKPLLHLTERPSASSALNRGAYHVAFNVPRRRDLAAQLKRIAREELALEGFADHGISEALYLPDPEGNGLEFTWDRPRSSWRYSDHQLEVTVDPLDVAGLLSELHPGADAENRLPTGTFLGHIHLYAVNPSEDTRWYQETFGMDVVMSGPWGIFLSRDDYHHHLALRQGSGVSHPDHDQGLGEIEASIEASRYQALAEPETAGIKTLTAPSGHRWRIRSLS
jgi:catechol 2,3-dioxygenase